MEQEGEKQQEALWEEPKGKYDNGKAPRTVKEQDYYHVEIEDEGGKGKRKKEKGMSLRR